MKRLFFLWVAGILFINACSPALPQPQSQATPISEADLQLTAAVIVGQTLQAFPTFTSQPTSEPTRVEPSKTATPTFTETPNPALLTLTATLLANTNKTSAAITTGSPSASTETTATNLASVTITAGTAQPLSYGTLPPKLPSGTINLFNDAQVDVYISLRSVSKDGYVTYLEYPVKKYFEISSPAGQYTYVAWVGGKKFEGAFSLDVNGFRRITFRKDKVTITK